MISRISLAGIAAAVLLLGAFFLAPVVSYSQPLALPFDERPNANTICLEAAGMNGTSLVFPVSLAQEQVYDACLKQELYPPYNLTGRASLSYSLLGVGSPPFPSPFEFTQGNYTGIVYFDGSSIAAAYLFPPGGQPSDGSEVLIDPSGIIEVVDATVSFTGFGIPVFNATVKNIGASPITGLGVWTTGLPVAFGSLNFTRGGIDWQSTYYGDCSAYLAPGRACSYQGSLGSLNATELRYHVQVAGFVGGERFFYREYVQQPAPEREPTQTWVSQFIGGVNQQRQGPPLTENSTLDRFAQQRFSTASSEPQISDYGLSSDAASFFGPSHPLVEELLLFPGSSAPYSYVSTLQNSFQKHFAELVDANFTQYGYYIGKAPYYDVSADCPVKEVPSAGVNITSYFEGYGCTVTPVPDMSWLVLILTG